MANTKISAEASAATLTGTELILGVQAGGMVSITPNQLATLVSSSSVTGTGLASNSTGFRGIPQNSQSADYTLVASDSGKHIYHPPADVAARTWTIDSNANVAFAIGTAITFENDFGAGAITIAITSDMLVLAGAVGSTGSRTLAAGGQATALKVGATRWRINGTGLT